MMPSRSPQFALCIVIVYALLFADARRGKSWHKRFRRVKKWPKLVAIDLEASDETVYNRSSVVMEDNLKEFMIARLGKVQQAKLRRPEHVGIPARSLSKESHYLIPLLPFGPNNQVLHLKWAFMLAGMLNRTVLLTGVFEHYMGLELNDTTTFYPTEILFNISSISEHFPLASVPDAKLAGWDGNITAMLQPDKFRNDVVANFMPRITKALDVHLNDNFTTVNWASISNCSDSGIQYLKKKLEGHRCVLIHPSSARWPVGMKRSDPLEPPWRAGSGDPCKDGYVAALSAVRKSKTLKDAARQFIEAEFGNEPFVAAHVRPYPDACARTWAKAGDLPRDQLLHPFCDNGGLAFDLAPTLMDVMERHSAKRLFVLTPPSIRHRVDTLLAYTGIKPSYIDLDNPAVQNLAEEVSSPPRVTLLLFLEQAISMKAVAFVGTQSSSATWMMIQERLAELGSPDAKDRALGINGDMHQTEYLFNRRDGSVPSNLTSK